MTTWSSRTRAGWPPPPVDEPAARARRATARASGRSTRSSRWRPACRPGAPGARGRRAGPARRRRCRRPRPSTWRPPRSRSTTRRTNRLVFRAAAGAAGRGRGRPGDRPARGDRRLRLLDRAAAGGRRRRGGPAVRARHRRADRVRAALAAGRPARRRRGDRRGDGVARPRSTARRSTWPTWRSATRVAAAATATARATRARPARPARLLRRALQALAAPRPTPSDGSTGRGPVESAGRRGRARSSPAGDDRCGGWPTGSAQLRDGRPRRRRARGRLAGRAARPDAPARPAGRPPARLIGGRGRPHAPGLERRLRRPPPGRGSAASGRSARWTARAVFGDSDGAGRHGGDHRFRRRGGSSGGRRPARPQPAGRTRRRRPARGRRPRPGRTSSATGRPARGSSTRIAPDAELVSIRVLGPDNRGRRAGPSRRRSSGRSGSGSRSSTSACRRAARRWRSGSTSSPTRPTSPTRCWWRPPTTWSARPIRRCSPPSCRWPPTTPGDPDIWFYNPAPPVEFGAHGLDVDVAWRGGTRIRATGNSFAAPHLAGRAALIRARHPDASPFEVKAMLAATATTRSDPPAGHEATPPGRSGRCRAGCVSPVGLAGVGLVVVVGRRAARRRGPGPLREVGRRRRASASRGPRRRRLVDEPLARAVRCRGLDQSLLRELGSACSSSPSVPLPVVQVRRP